MMIDKPIEVQLAIIATNLEQIRKDVEDIKREQTRLDSEHSTKYVTQDQFMPIQKLVYGLVGTILISVVAAVLAVVLKT